MLKGIRVQRPGSRVPMSHSLNSVLSVDNRKTAE